MTRRDSGRTRLRTRTTRLAAAVAALGVLVAGGPARPAGRALRGLAAELAPPEHGASVASVALTALVLLVTGGAALAWSHRCAPPGRSDREA